jgi:uncharacterized repeat protein (TIGR01451 family)
VASNDTLVYTLTYGNRSNANVTGTTLTLPLPAGVTFDSASNSGSLVNNNVIWSLSTLTAGQVGRQQVTAIVNADVSSGTVLAIDAARLGGTHVSAGVEEARATNATRVGPSNPITLSVSVSPNPVGVAGSFTGTLLVHNASGSDLTGVTLVARYPSYGLYNLDQTLLSPLGDCNTANTNNYCDANELIIWNVGNLATNADYTVTIPLNVLPAQNGIVNGDLILLDAEVTSNAGGLTTAGDTEIVGAGAF